MLDPKILREEPDKIRSMLKARAVNFDLDALIKIDKQKRELIIKTDELRKKRNDISLAIGKSKKEGKDTSSLLDQMKKVSADLEQLESDQNKIETQYTKLAFTIPNLIHESVPVGPDAASNKEIRKWGKIPQFDFTVKDHIDFSQALDLVDLERAAKIAGARFYALKNDLVRLNQALINYALDFLSEKKYTLVQPPFMINKASMDGAIITEDFENVIYKIQDGNNLPIRYAGISPCFRKEAGAHGRDQKGIFRVHQFEKVEQFVFSRPEDSWKEHEKILSVAEEFYQKLGIPYRVVLLSSGDMGKISAKTYDIEVWMAGQDAYREIVSCSNCLDYQARRLMIRFRDKTNEPTKYIHTLNSTLVATSRTLVAIMENFQTKDGHILVPQVLQKYFGKSTI